MDTRELVQDNAINALNESAKDGVIRGTIEAITGIGKTFIALKMIKLLNPKTVLFLAESELREVGVKEDIVKFKELTGYDILANHTITFMCYQGAYKKVSLYHDLVIADEIHDSLTPKYFKYYENNSYTHLIGLSATIDKKSTFIIDEQEVTKLDLLNKIAPIVFSYKLKQGQEDKTSRTLDISIIMTELDTKTKNVLVKYKDKKGNPASFYQTEREYYDYCHQRFISAMYGDNDFLKNYWMRKRNEILYNLPSKTDAVITLLKAVDLKRTIVFGNSIEQLIKICPTVSSKRSVELNKKLISDFNSKKINTIGSFKMLKQGANLIDLDTVILHSYYSIEKDFIQRVGRLRNRPEKGNVIIFVTRGTQEETWVNKIIEATKLQFNTFQNIKEFIKNYV